MSWTADECALTEIRIMNIVPKERGTDGYASKLPARRDYVRRGQHESSTVARLLDGRTRNADTRIEIKATLMYTFLGVVMPSYCHSRFVSYYIRLVVIQ